LFVANQLLAKELTRQFKLLSQASFLFGTPIALAFLSPLQDLLPKTFVGKSKA